MSKIHPVPDIVGSQVVRPVPKPDSSLAVLQYMPQLLARDLWLYNQAACLRRWSKPQMMRFTAKRNQREGRYLTALQLLRLGFFFLLQPSTSSEGRYKFFFLGTVSQFNPEPCVGQFSLFSPWFSSEGPLLSRGVKGPGLSPHACTLRGHWIAKGLFSRLQAVF